MIFLFFDKNKFALKIKKKISSIGIINTKSFEMLLYAFRFCVQTLDALNTKNLQNKRLFFSQIFSPYFLNSLQQYYVPGNETLDMHLITLEFVENHLSSNPDNIGCYICSCGYYYSIQPCGFPTRGSTSTCPICGLKIGYGDRKIIVGYHGLVRREGHYRIFKNEDQHRTCMNRYKDSDENVPNMTLEQYKKKIIEPIKKNSPKGLNVVNKDWFLKRDKKIRNLNELSYRILNYIFYSHLFFANCLDLINDAELKKYLVKDMKCIDILEKDWEIIGEILRLKGINSIQIFMNLIFKKLSTLIKECNCFTTDNSRNSFEDEFEKVINNCLKEYQKYSAKYIEENKKLLELKNDNFQSIIQELSSPADEAIYPSQEYPLFKYFILTKYSTKDEFIKKIGPPNVYALKYPLLRQYLLDNPDTKKIKYLPNFNEFTNYMVEKYSFKISREEAKKKILKYESIVKEKGFDVKFNNFIKAWDEIKSEAIKYKCRPEMAPKTLKQGDQLSYFLNDDGELGFGMYLASACQNFITWQNSFLQPIIDSVAQNGILHYFAKNMQRKIPVQSAKINQTLLIEDCFNNSLLYNNFEELISTFCTRDIFNENGKINYLNYNTFVYDFDSIEE